MFKILIFNHHFDQDIAALRKAGGSAFEFKLISPEVFLVPAQQYFPESVFLADLSEYHRERFAKNRLRWARRAKALLNGLYMLYPFDAIVTPSDTFFYFRDAINVAKEMGIPTIVLQKEHYMSPKSLQEHSVLMKKYFPFISDFMTVCSIMSKHFWELAGTSTEKISIIGQPRFDFYKQPETWSSLHDLGLQLDAVLPVVLFFSYDLGAYFDEFMISGSMPWRKLREETEDVLFDYVNRNMINLIIKPHPQQAPRDVARLVERVRSKCANTGQKNIALLEGGVDARQLIVNADYVISFQTTALLEALGTGKKVIYTYWTENVRDVEPNLLPYHKYSNCIDCATSRESFIEILDAYLLDRTAGCKHDEHSVNQLIEQYQGKIDGLASKRFLEILRRRIEVHRKERLENETIKASIAKLHQKRYLYLYKELVSAFLQIVTITAILKLSYPVIRFCFGHVFLKKIEGRLSFRKKRMQECLNEIKGRSVQCQTLVGSIPDGILFYIRRKLVQYL